MPSMDPKKLAKYHMTHGAPEHQKSWEGRFKRFSMGLSSNAP